MAQNPMIEQAKQGNVSAITALMNRLLKSQGMLANVEREGDRLEVLIESDLRSLDDEVRVPKRQVLVRMLKKWFRTLEVQTISKITISWQQAGFDAPAWTEEISLLDDDTDITDITDIPQNGGGAASQERPRIPPLPIFPPKSMRNDEQRDRSSEKISSTSETDLDEIFGEVSHPVSLPNIPTRQNFSSESEYKQPFPEAEPFFLADVPAIPDSSPTDEGISDFQSPKFTFNPRTLTTIFTTPSFAIQLIQYVLICGVIILTLRGIHGVFGGGKAPKAASIETHTIV
ncbi:hypothetical protein [Pseudanabaena yagii]|uniref:Uncharacterized protein n=1 Tax=Pseudanabaena yagii GIHE-NHR1 TaxID=2722753 RepID=A0ABX1LMW1_9CYAN|nr:hypothetical protein [Pseudanabaena yagii]NMF57472.1 hypothetical protein [Pseudanabaena yagii GIHE-NHR1]